MNVVLQPLAELQAQVPESDILSSYRDCTMARKPLELVDLLRRVAELLQQTADLALRVVGTLGS